MSSHRLAGLEVDNLLGFLALLGLLRALGRSRPQWAARAYFGGSPLSAHLEIAQEATEEEIAQAASEGCESYAGGFTFGEYKDLTFSSDVARTLLERSLSSETTATIMSALCSDAAKREKDDRIIATPLCAMFGQGHQSFLSRLTSVSAGTPPKTRAARERMAPLNDPCYVARALFSPWAREDAAESFRWDFVEDRRYALRYSDPSSDPPTTEHGANRLAIIGMLSFQSAPSLRGRTADLAVRGVSRSRETRRLRITWPIWYRPASLEAIHAMLEERELADDHPAFKALARYGVDQARRVYRITSGKFISFSRAMALLPP